MLLAITILFVGCTAPKATLSLEGAVEIVLSDNGVTVDGADAAFDGTTSLIPAVYTQNDILYYPEGKDFTFGAAEDGEAHSAEEADAHTVVHITAPGTYKVSGKLSNGQIAVDLGENAKDDPNAVVNLVLDGVDLTCKVAPAIIFYNVWECGSDDEKTAQAEVDTSKAGANLWLADGSENTVNGSYVARIYESYELSDDGKTVEDYETLHKYDGAVYSCMSMNVLGRGTLNIFAENEGLDSELHLTLDGPTVNINSANDGINTNEDGVSVTTMQSGVLNITVNGKTGEGDGIDSNGWLVVNGGTVIASACGDSMDSGIDSDLGIHLNGGTVIASGKMLDRIGESKSTFAVFNFMTEQAGGAVYTLKDKNGNTVLEATPQNNFTSLILSSPDLKEGTYTLWQGEAQLSVAQGGGMRFGGGRPQGDFDPENMPEGFDPQNMPEGFDPQQMPEGFDPENMPEGFGPGGRPENFDPEQMPAPNGDFEPEKMPAPNGDFDPEQMPKRGERPDGDSQSGPNTAMEFTTEFTIQSGENQFTVQ